MVCGLRILLPGMIFKTWKKYSDHNNICIFREVIKIAPYKSQENIKLVLVAENSKGL